jgi:uroporphyrinogen decarboxylase
MERYKKYKNGGWFIMTGRERLMKSFKGEQVDRVPICPFVYYNFVYEYFNVEMPDIHEFMNPTVFDVEQKTIELHEHFGFDLLHRLGSIWDFADVVSGGENWIVDQKEEMKEDNGIQTTTIKTPEKELRQVKVIKKNSKYLWVEAINEYFIKTPEDFEQFVKYQPEKIILDCSRITKTKKLVGEKGLTAVCTVGAYNFLNYYRKLDDIITDPFEDEWFYRKMIRYFTDRLKKIYKLYIEAGADVINIGANNANGTLMGPLNFKKYVLEYEKELNEMVKKEGAFVLYHNCGDAGSLLDVYRELPMDAYETLTPPPLGDTIFEEALEKFNKDVTLVGNIDQVEFLKTATPEQVKERVKDIVEKGKKRGNFILSTSDFFFENTPYENIKAFVKTGLEFGKY